MATICSAKNACDSNQAADLNAANTNVACFADGTLIATAQGNVRIEDLKVGDLVQTMDSGLQPLRWIGCRHVNATALAANDSLRPIRIGKDVTGIKRLAQDLVVSPQHRILIASRVAQRMFGHAQVLTAAKQLLVIDGVDIAQDIDTVSYYHLLFDQHEIIMANGVPAESLYLGTDAQHALTVEGRAEIALIFPDIATASYVPHLCRPITIGKQAEKIAFRHAKNCKPLFDPRIHLDTPDSKLTHGHC